MNENEKNVENSNISINQIKNSKKYFEFAKNKFINDEKMIPKIEGKQNFYLKN
jgi:hypothetical protein